MRRRTFEIVAWHNRATICARALRELGANVTRRDVLRYWSGMLPWRWLGRPDASAAHQDTKALPWWALGGEAMCLLCLRKNVPDTEEIYGGYPIETDKAPCCPMCGCDLDLVYIGDEPAWRPDAGAVGE